MKLKLADDYVTKTNETQYCSEFTSISVTCFTAQTEVTEVTTSKEAKRNDLYSFTKAYMKRLYRRF